MAALCAAAPAGAQLDNSANRAKLFVGTPKMVRAKLEPLIAATKADEIMITTMVYDQTARMRFGAAGVFVAL